jgi:hypothetical protein
VVGAAPEGCTHLFFALNVLVYGLDRESLARIARDTADEIAGSWGGAVAVAASDVKAHDSHHHH